MMPPCPNCNDAHAPAFYDRSQNLYWCSACDTESVLIDEEDGRGED